MKTWVWVLLCSASFLGGYSLNGFLLAGRAREESRRHLISGVTWAIESGLLIINPDKTTRVGATAPADDVRPLREDEIVH